MTNNRKVGENQLTKTIRLLKQLTQELVKYPENEDLELNLDNSGRGDIIYIDVDGNQRVLFSFENVDVLLEYLEGSQLSRLLLTIKS